MVKLIVGTLTSLKSAVMLIVIITLLAVTGTLLPQNLEAADYLNLYPKTARLILALGFDDMYHSTAFQACLWLLSISALLCVLSRRRAIKDKIFNRLMLISENEIEHQPSIKASAASFKASWQKEFKQFKKLENGAKIYYKPTGRLSLLGSMLIHTGLLVLLAGGLIGVYCGVETVICGAEGDKIAVAPLSAVKAAKKADQLARQARIIREFSPDSERLKGLRTRVEQLQSQYFEGLKKPVFRVAFDKLWVENYKSDGKKISGIKSWNSKIRFIDSGEQNASESFIIRVNHPIAHQNYTFYQAGWGKKYRKIKLLIEPNIAQAGANNASHTIEPIIGVPADISFAAPLIANAAQNAANNDNAASKVFEPLGNAAQNTAVNVAKIEVSRFFSDFRIVNQHFVNMSNELKNPAAMIIGYNKEGKAVGRAWAFAQDKAAMAGHTSSLPYRFTFLGAASEYESTLQMTHDPGQPLVWLGCIILSLGMIMSFYIACIEYWAISYPDGAVLLAVSGNRPPKLLKQYLTALEARLCGADKGAVSNER